jgi:hypothetical protein
LIRDQKIILKAKIENNKIIPSLTGISKE